MNKLVIDKSMYCRHQACYGNLISTNLVFSLHGDRNLIHQHDSLLRNYSPEYGIDIWPVLSHRSVPSLRERYNILRSYYSDSLQSYISTRQILTCDIYLYQAPRCSYTSAFFNKKCNSSISYSQPLCLVYIPSNQFILTISTAKKWFE